MFNRPVSRAISTLVLRYTDLKPVHATLGTAAIALAMTLALLFGGAPGLVAGGLLFHAASVFDGVDGEMARATWRSSRAGASFDSIVDVLTNLFFVLGLTLNLAARHGRIALVLGGLSLGLLLIGFALSGATGTPKGKFVSNGSSSRSKRVPPARPPCGSRASARFSRRQSSLSSSCS